MIKEVIEWNDGLNHVRAGNEFIRCLRQTPSRLPRKETPLQRTIRWLRKAALLLIPGFLEPIPKLAGICSVKKNFSKKQLDDTGKANCVL